MDIEKIRRLSKNASEAGKLVKAVTAFKNELKDREQMRDITMSDHFKTLREPLIKQQKKTDEKQDQVIEQLKKNQLALTSGIQDIMTLNQELPQITPEELQLTTPPVEEATRKKPVLEINLGKTYNQEELGLIKDLDLINPTQLVGFKQDQLNEYKDKVKELRKLKGDKTKGFAKTEEGQKVKANIKKEVAVLDKYLESIKDANKIFVLTSPVKGTGIKQPKRNAYKIQDGVYGGLVIDLPKLFNEMKLKVFRGGKLIYSADADKSLINLLTKRFNPKTKYSMNAVRIFNDLNMLSNMPKHRSSGKSRMVGSSVTYYNNANELADRIKILIGSIAAGNNSPVIRNDLSQINDELLRINAIDKSRHEKFYQKYLSR